MIKVSNVLILFLTGLLMSCSTAKVKEYVKLKFISTTEDNSWQEGAIEIGLTEDNYPGIEIFTDSALQKMVGFGACFNELGWESLKYLNNSQRDSIFKELFAPGYGASFNFCRMPLGANDFSRDWYSYEREG